MPPVAARADAKGATKGKATGKKPVKEIAKKQSRKPDNPELARHAGKMMKIANSTGPGSYPGSREAFQHHSGKTLASSMGSQKQSDLSAGVARLTNGALGGSFAKCGVVQMLA